MLEDVHDVHKMLVYKYGLITWLLTWVKLHIQQYVVQQVLRNWDIVLGQFENKGTSWNLAYSLLITLQEAIQ